MLDIQSVYRTSEDSNYKSNCIPEWQSIPLNEFLYYCATKTFRKALTINNKIDMAHYRERFIHAGLTELTNCHQQAGWVQLNLMTDGCPFAELYHQLKEFFSKHLETGIIKNAFFMHKAPGLRIRLQATQPSDIETLKQEMISHAQHWKNQQLISQYQHAIYEPEITFFGGPFSMPWIHALFTADSLYWLNVHSQNATGKDAVHHLKLSLILLRHLFSALQIVDWEDIDVWNKVSEKTGRSFSAGYTLDPTILSAVQTAILDIWDQPSTVLSELAEEERDAIQALIGRFNELTQQWRENYFLTEHACIGPRSAAAAYLIFFWNRANINFEQQRIATYALSHRNVLD